MARIKGRPVLIRHHISDLEESLILNIYQLRALEELILRAEQEGDVSLALRSSYDAARREVSRIECEIRHCRYGY